MTGIELVVGYLAAWGIRKLRRATAAVDAEADRVVDAALDHLYQVVTDKLGDDPAVAKLEAAPDQVSDRVRQRVELALADAADDDPDFAQALTQAVEAVRQAEQATGTDAVSASRRGVAAGRDIDVTASDGGVAGVNLGDVSVGYPPGRPGTGEGDRPSLSETVAALIRRGLGPGGAAQVSRSERTGLPVVRLGTVITTENVCERWMTTSRGHAP